MLLVVLTTKQALLLATWATHFIKELFDMMVEFIHSRLKNPFSEIEQSKKYKTLYNLVTKDQNINNP